MSYNPNGNNFSTAEDYLCEMVNPTVYSSYCKLVAAGNIFPFLFEIYYNNNFYSKFGVHTFSVTGNIRGYFNVYLSISKSSY